MTEDEIVEEDVQPEAKVDDMDVDEEYEEETVFVEDIYDDDGRVDWWGEPFAW